MLRLCSTLKVLCHYQSFSSVGLMTTLVSQPYFFLKVKSGSLEEIVTNTGSCCQYIQSRESLVNQDHLQRKAVALGSLKYDSPVGQKTGTTWQQNCRIWNPLSQTSLLSLSCSCRYYLLNMRTMSRQKSARQWLFYHPGNYQLIWHISSSNVRAVIIEMIMWLYPRTVWQLYHLSISIVTNGFT